MTECQAHYHWRVAPYHLAEAKKLGESAGLSPLVAHLMLLRGVNTPEQMHLFLHPTLRQLTDPFDLPDMQAAVARIVLAKERNEAVLVFGDYDVDGIAAAAIMTRGLKRYGIARVAPDMPDRFAEGYGLSPARVEQAHREGYSLIITVDNGISAHAAARRAREIGIDMIITDHHAIDATLPDALAVVNPKRGDQSHLAADISGAGVAFKLATALNGAPHDLDLAALGAVSDIVPLLNENRVIVALGIKHMQRYQRIGLAKLADTAKFSLNQVTSYKMGFQLGPRLNAAGRLDTGHTALELLMTECEEQARALAKDLHAANEERRKIEKSIFEEAETILEAFLTEQQRAIVLAHEEWHQGVIGIVASRLQTKYHRPVIVCCRGDDGYWHGSARGIPHFNMIEALHACEHHLIRYGGHVAAAGISLAQENLEPFRSDFEAEALRQLGTEPLERTLHVDAQISLSELNGSFINNLQCMEPYGQGNPEPVFCSMNVKVVPHSVRILKEQHLKMSLQQGDMLLNAIGFRMAERYYEGAFPDTLDIVFTPHLNIYNGTAEIQVHLKDFRSATDIA